MKNKSRPKIKIRPINDKCPYCEGTATPSYKKPDELKPYITDRARIMSTARSGVCSRHQRILAKEIKLARFLALLPMTEKD